MLLTCQKCSRRFDVVAEKVEGLCALRCECGSALPLGGKGLQRLGKYLLLHKIAVGGMGEIYYGVVSGVEGFEREVAIKKMLPHLNQDRSFVEMMIKEAKLTVLLNHANIVQVYDLAREAESYYIAMEYVPGVTVAHILQQSIADEVLLPVPVAVNVATQLLRGLMYAHNLPTPSGTLSIIHRDITPQNILVTARGVVKITDYGIARAANEISTTSPGLIKGKLGYIAPEQLAGHAPSPQVDLFCAAIVLWEMLAGRRLFKGTTEIDTFRLISEAEIPDLRTLRGDVPTGLMQVLQKALAKAPDDRFAHGDAFADALLGALAPLTAVDLRTASEQFFRANKRWFGDVYVHDGSAKGVVPAEELTHISRVAQVAPPAAMPPPPPPTPMGGAHSEPTLLIADRHRGRPSTALWLGAGGLAVAGVVGMAATWMLRAPASTAVPAAPIAAIAPLPTSVNANAPVANVASNAAPPRVPAASGTASSEGKVPSKRGAVRKPKRAQPSEDAPLTGAEIQHTVAQHQGAIARCLRGLDSQTAPKEVVAKLTIARDGHVSSLHFEPPFEGEQGKCVQHSLQALMFRRHPYEGLQVTIPLRLQVF